MYKLAVIGNPILHSMSPTIFEIFAKECKINLVYEKLLAKDTLEFNDIVTEFFKQGGFALNITSPFKSDAFKLAKLTTARAKFCGAANFLRLDENNDIIADTTDGIGLITDIQVNKNLNLRNKNILIIGSGFVLDSVLLDLIAINPFAIDILARNQNRTDCISNKFGCGRFSLNKKYDFILNTVPNDTNNELLPQIKELKNDSFCYDMAYSDFLSNKFYQYMKTLNPNIQIYSGIGMLVEQAKVAFEQLFNLTPDVHSVLQQISRG